MKTVLAQATKEEVDSLELIQNKLETSKTASSPSILSDDVPDSIKVAYFKAALDNLAEARFLESDWWKTIKETYTLPDVNIHIDFKTKELYVLGDES